MEKMDINKVVQGDEMCIHWIGVDVLTIYRVLTVGMD
jgi:hypothetical protein